MLMTRLLCHRAALLSALRPNAMIYGRTKVTVPHVNAGIQRRRRLKPKLGNDKFTLLANQFLDRVQIAVAPLFPPVNDGLVLHRTKDVVTIETPSTAFEIKVLYAKEQLQFTSPISGLRMYEWNRKTTRWEDETDAHDIEGLLTRDLMRVYMGIPLF